AAFTIPSEAMKAIVANIERIERGEAPQGVVNMELGY
ncbi:glyoxylate/hydroxypyruvate reductase GhrA, partial [Klebsiella pneumoniae]|nr:glyoxylate/hydroxypyruvate reductase GhrA [Klebsiella pneumoniae]